MTALSEVRTGSVSLAFFATMLFGVAALTGCSPASTAEPAQLEAEDEVATDTASGLEETDFSNLGWMFRPGGNVPEVQQIELVEGKATDGIVSYEVGEVIHAELTGDDRVDAIVQITMVDGNAFDEQWYLWIATESGPVQSTLPVARMAPCGTVIHSISAVDGGVQIHESRRTLGDDLIPCSDPGSDERTRTVSAIEARNTGEWWPVQTGPISGFGGLCPATAHLDSYKNDSVLYSVPDTAVGELIAFDGPSEVFEIEAWPVYGEAFPGWVLAGVQNNGSKGCAWAERS